MSLIKKSNLSALFVVIVLATEFYQIEVFGGFLRLYHFLAPLVIFSFWGRTPSLAKAGLFWALLAFILWNVAASFFSEDLSSSLASLALLMVNASLAFAVALMILSNRISLEKIINIALGVATFGVILGIIQITTFKISGVNLGLSESQEGQIIAGFSAGIKTEANTFAKFLNVVVLLTLPRVLSVKNRRESIFILIFLSAGMLTSFTRSVIYSLCVSLVIIYFWYQISGRGKVLSILSLKILGVSGLGLILFSTVVGNFNEYAAHKLNSFFDTQEILHGGSAGFRLMSQGVLWDAFLENENTFWTGNGWGQVTFIYGEVEKQAGGAEIITALAYGGLIGGILYLLYMFSAIFGILKTIKHRRDNGYYRAREGVMFAVVGLFVTGQLNGSMNAPEYWLVFGMAMAICAMGNETSGVRERQDLEEAFR